MVAMEYLDPSKFERASNSGDDLKAAVLKVVAVLHERGFVHDLQDCNMICRKEDGVWGGFLLDFDWSGKHREVQYPENINRITINRPDGCPKGRADSKVT